MIRPTSRQYSFMKWCIVMKLRALITCLAVIVLLPSFANADVLTIPNLNKGSINDAQDISRPSRGMTMEEVSAQFGEPQEKKPPVGDPPITRWVYEKFTVHFERNYVIHTVVQRQ